VAYVNIGVPDLSISLCTWCLSFQTVIVFSVAFLCPDNPFFSYAVLFICDAFSVKLLLEFDGILLVIPSGLRI
jgi:hypothetical protein